MAPRSLSLPTSSPEDIRLTSLAYSARPEPHVVCPDAPLTPPLSPKPGQHMNSIAKEDDECAPLALESHEPEHISHISSDLMDVDAISPVDDSVQDHPAPRPQRLLEDEKVHLQRSGIKLSDFEVRGALGAPLRHSSLPDATFEPYPQAQGRSARFSLFVIATPPLRRARKIILQ